MPCFVVRGTLCLRTCALSPLRELWWTGTTGLLDVSCLRVIAVYEMCVLSLHPLAGLDVGA